METMTYTALRGKLASTLDQVNDDHTPVLITRQNGKPAVLMSLDDFNAYETTAYLLSNPVNTTRLRESMADVEAGRIFEKDLVKHDDQNNNVE